MKKVLGIVGLLLGTCVIAFLLLGVFMPRLDYKITFEVNKPVEQTFKVFMDASLAGQWMTGFKRMETISGKPGDVGSKYRFIFEGGKEDVIVDEEVLAVKPNELFVFSVDNEFLTGKGEFRFKDKNGMTEITYINDTAGRNFIFKCVLALFRPSIRERNTKEFEKLKSIIESK